MSETEQRPPFSGTINRYEPMLSNRFIVEFLDTPPWLIQSCTLPKLINHNGIIYWKTIKIDFIEVIGRSTSTMLFKLIEDVMSGKSVLTFTIKLVDPTGVSVSEWEIIVDQISDIKFGKKLDYGNKIILTNTLTIKPKDCILKY